MIKEFEKHDDCIFKARLEEKFLPEKDKVSTEYYSSYKNIVFTEKSTKQQNILSKTNTKLFISHCGVNGLNEAMYTGVPLICIPWGEDQFYNGSLVEQKGLGIYVKHNMNFRKAFKNALNNILTKNNE
uniref:glucuronosyltransferase n=1 Tax=Meloidogyne incognita TaxID=6306 RepID=A0A914M035_MELIC